MKIRLIEANQKKTTSKNEIAILVDILRASSTITTAIFYGAKTIMPTLELHTAFKLSKDNNALLMGERNCVKIKNFDLGNSPTEITEKKVRDKNIIFSSTNFPKTLSLSKNSSLIIIGSFLNLNVITKFAYNYALKNTLDICFVLAGSEVNTSEEDFAFAGASALILSKYDNISLDKKNSKSSTFYFKQGIRKFRIKFYSRQKVD